VVAKAQTGMLVQGEDQLTYEKVPSTRKEVAVSMRLWDVVDHYRWCSLLIKRADEPACTELEDLADAGFSEPKAEAAMERIRALGPNGGGLESEPIKLAPSVLEVGGVSSTDTVGDVG